MSNDNKPSVPASQQRPQTVPAPTPSPTPQSNAAQRLADELEKVTQERDQEKRRADRLSDDGQRLNLLCDQLRAEVASLTASLSSAEQSLAAASAQLSAETLVDIGTPSSPEWIKPSGFKRFKIHEMNAEEKAQHSDGITHSLQLDGESVTWGNRDRIKRLMDEIQDKLGQKRGQK